MFSFPSRRRTTRRAWLPFLSRDGDRLVYLVYNNPNKPDEVSFFLSFVQGVDPSSSGGGGGGGGGGAPGGVRSASPRAAGGAADGEGLDDLSLSSVSSTLASFFLFLAILR